MPVNATCRKADTAGRKTYRRPVISVRQKALQQVISIMRKNAAADHYHAQKRSGRSLPCTKTQPEIITMRKTQPADLYRA